MLVHLRRGLAAAMLLMIVLAAPPASATTPTADGPDLVTFGISPAGTDRPDGRPYLSYSAAPGTTIYDQVALLNQDDQPIGLEVYSGDVIQADAGLSVRPKVDTSVDAGSWIAVGGPTQVEVPAQTATAGVGYTIVPFTLTIPADAQPGDHLGGIVASLVTRGTGGANTPGITLDQRVAARVYIQVSGDLAPGLVVTRLGATWEPGGVVGAGAVTVRYTLHNTGNMRMAVEPSASVSGVLGMLSRSAKGDRVDDLLPGAEVEQEVTISRVWPLGLETVTVTAHAAKPSVGERPNLHVATASMHVWALAWWHLVVLALVLALVARLVVRRRRRRAWDRSAEAEAEDAAGAAAVPTPPEAATRRSVRTG